MPADQPKKKSALVVTILTATVLVVCALLAFHFYQVRFAKMFMQGFWQITENAYLLIDGKTMKICEFTPTGMLNSVGATPSNVDISVNTILPIHKYKATLTCEDAVAPSGPIQLGKKVIVELSPIVGAMNVLAEGKVVMSLIKDNEMTLEYFR